MAPTEPKLALAYSGLVSQLKSKLGGTDYWFRPAPPVLDYDPDVDDVWSGDTRLYVYPFEAAPVEGERTDTFGFTWGLQVNVEGYATGHSSWVTIARLLQDVQRAVQEDTGLGCNVHSARWAVIDLRSEVVRREEGIARRASFAGELVLVFVEEF
jgi:hypothetical protein